MDSSERLTYTEQGRIFNQQLVDLRYINSGGRVRRSNGGKDSGQQSQHKSRGRGRRWQAVAKDF